MFFPFPCCLNKSLFLMPYRLLVTKSYSKLFLAMANPSLQLKDSQSHANHYYSNTLFHSEKFMYVIAKDDAELDLPFNFHIGGFDYVVFATTGKLGVYAVVKKVILSTIALTELLKTATEDIVNEPAAQQLAEMDRAEPLRK